MTEADGADRVRTPLLLLAALYGGLICMAGVLGAKLVAVGPLGVEGGVVAFLLLVVTANVTAECYGRTVATRLVACGFVPLMFAMVLTRLVVLMPAASFASPRADKAFALVLTQSSRLMIAGLIASATSQFANVFIFTRISHGKALVWLRALIAGVLSQALDTLVFITLAFAGVVPLAPLIAGQLIVKLTLATLVVPPLTAAGSRLARRDWRHRNRRSSLAGKTPPAAR